MALLKSRYPGRDIVKYPHPNDEPMLEQCRRMGIRPGRPGESNLEWGQSDPFYLAKPVSEEEKLREWEEIKALWDAYEAEKALHPDPPEPIKPKQPSSEEQLRASRELLAATAKSALIIPAKA